MFTIAAIVHICGVTFYGLFASGELQPWAETGCVPATPTGIIGLSKAGGGPPPGTGFPEKPTVPPPTYQVTFSSTHVIFMSAQTLIFVQ